MGRSFAILIVTALALSACAYWGDKGKEDRFAKCPHVEMLGAAQGWIVPPGDDWTARAEISEYNTECKVNKTTATMTVKAKLGVERNGDAAARVTQDLPLFVATMQGDAVIDKKLLTDTVKFRAHEKIIKDEYDMKVEFPIAAGGTAADKTLIFGFQLNADQLAYFAAMRQKQMDEALKSAIVLPGPATK